jgi:hypothetical protein
MIFLIEDQLHVQAAASKGGGLIFLPSFDSTFIDSMSASAARASGVAQIVGTDPSLLDELSTSPRGIGCLTGADGAPERARSSAFQRNQCAPSNLPTLRIGDCSVPRDRPV